MVNDGVLTVRAASCTDPSVVSLSRGRVMSVPNLLS